MPAIGSYQDSSGRDDVLSGGARRIPVSTPKGEFKVWVKRVGNNPGLRLLLLHGGPGMTHEYLEACDSYLPGAGVEYYYYDQLGSGFSDQPDEPSLWSLTGSWTSWSRSARRSAWTVTASCSTASRGAASSAWSTP